MKLKPNFLDFGSGIRFGVLILNRLFDMFSSRFDWVLEGLRLVASLLFWYLVLILQLLLEVMQWRNCIPGVFDQVVETKAVVQICVDAWIQLAVLIWRLPWVLSGLTLSRVVRVLLRVFQQLGDLGQIELGGVLSSHVAVGRDDSAQLRVRSFPVVWSTCSIPVVDLAANLVKQRFEGVSLGCHSGLVGFWWLVIH